MATDKVKATVLVPASTWDRFLKKIHRKRDKDGKLLSASGLFSRWMEEYLKGERD